MPLNPSGLTVAVEAFLLAVAAFFLTVLVGHFLVPWLREHRLGKKVRAEGPERHQAKAGTPTMGGLMIIPAVTLVTAAFNLAGRWSMLLPLGVLLSFGALGLVDDLHSLVGRKGNGLRARTKFATQVLIGLGAGVLLRYGMEITSVYIPLVGKFSLGPAYLGVAVLVLVATSNAVNLTDGLDGLAAGTLLAAFTAYGLIGFLQGQTYVAIFCATTIGGLLGFLWYNLHPAQVFMGDTGALGLGAALGSVALLTGQWLLLPLIGGVFVAEALSVILQVAYFKRTGGKRLFRMSPLHHHFELSGWSETQVVGRFTIVALLFALLGVALALA